MPVESILGVRPLHSLTQPTLSFTWLPTSSVTLSAPSALQRQPLRSARWSRKSRLLCVTLSACSLSRQLTRVDSRPLPHRGPRLPRSQRQQSALHVHARLPSTLRPGSTLLPDTLHLLTLVYVPMQLECLKLIASPKFPDKRIGISLLHALCSCVFILAQATSVPCCFSTSSRIPCFSLPTPLKSQ